MKSSSQKREHVIIVPGGLLATSADADAGCSVAIKGGWRTGRRVWRPSQPDPRLEEGAARRRVFENGSERDDKTNETQVGELYRQIGQLKVENDFLRLGKEAGPRDDRASHSVHQPAVPPAGGQPTDRNWMGRPSPECR